MRLRTIAPRFASLRPENASALVIAVGSPSGTAATASAAPTSTADPTRWGSPTVRAYVAIAAIAPIQTDSTPSRPVRRVSCRCNGVGIGFASSIPAIAPDTGACPCRCDHRAGGPGEYLGPGECRVPDLLRNGGCLPREHRFVDLEAVRRSQCHIGRHVITGRQVDDVAAYEQPCRDGGDHAIALYTRVRADKACELT